MAHFHWKENGQILTIDRNIITGFMDKEDIKILDLKRLLIGNTPVEFMIEVFFRTLFIYLILLVVLRLLGKRMTSQANILEYAVLLTLGAIIALPMQDPARGVLPGVVLLFCILGFQRFANWWSYKNAKVESVIQGRMSLLLKDGVINIREMQNSALSHEELYAELRQNDIRHLGQVQRIYLEACGIFSIFRYDKPRPGLSVIPDRDEKLSESLRSSERFSACKNCGNIEEEKPRELQQCRNCGENDWKAATIERKSGKGF